MHEKDREGRTDRYRRRVTAKTDSLKIEMGEREGGAEKARGRTGTWVVRETEGEGAAGEKIETD